MRPWDFGDQEDDKDEEVCGNEEGELIDWSQECKRDWIELNFIAHVVGVEPVWSLALTLRVPPVSHYSISQM